MNCQEITTQLQGIHQKREQYGTAIGERNFTEAFRIQPELTKLIDQLKKELHPVIFTIEGKEFPVFSLVIGGKDKEQLKAELKESGIFVSGSVLKMLDSPEFTTLENPEEISLVKLKVSDLGFSYSVTTDQIYARAKKLGLELCPAEVGPHQCFKEKIQPTSDFYQIAMKKFAGVRDITYRFQVYRDRGNLCLGDGWMSVAGGDSPDRLEFVFRVPSDSEVGSEK